MISDEAKRSIYDVVQSAVHTDDDPDGSVGTVVTKIYLIVEVMCNNGNKMLITHSSDGVTTWDAKGLLIEALEMEKGCDDEE